MNKPTPAPFVSNVARHPTRYKFEVFMLDGTRKPDLKRSFLRVIEIDCSTGAYNSNETMLVTEDGLKWKLIYDTDIETEQGLVKCIVSFQAFHDGERIAVARKYNKEQNNG